MPPLGMYAIMAPRSAVPGGIVDSSPIAKRSHTLQDYAPRPGTAWSYPPKDRELSPRADTPWVGHGGQTLRGTAQCCPLGNQMPVVQAKLVEDVFQMELDCRLARAFLI